MATALIRLDGFEDLLRQMSTMPERVRSEARAMLHEETEGAAAEIRSSYQAKVKGRKGTGNLVGRVRVTYPSSTELVGVVSSASPHAHLFEFGTAKRETDKGWNRGAAEGRPTTPAIAQRRRANLRRRLISLVESEGFTVTES